MNANESRPLTLRERISRVDALQARRFEKLSGVTLNIASEGILRHLKACDRMNVEPDPAAIREIVDDALNGKRVFATTNEDNLLAN